ncbi:type VI secretion system tube protein Hcp [Acetobacteraceae bacterium]|nr:type VI secretion system tube protein Hcp [Acetobacteraceae bacterium]
MGVYLKYNNETIGDVTEAQHKGWVEILDLDWNMTRSIRNAVGVGKNRESSSANVSELAITKYIDSASHKFVTYAFTGQAKEAQIDFTRVNEGGETLIRTIVLKNAIMAKMENSYTSRDQEKRLLEDTRPLEKISFNFTEITISDYGEDLSGKPKGPSRVIYDLTQAKTL